MNKEQVIKLLKVAIYCTALMLAFEILFSFNVITNWLTSLVENAGIYAYLVIWLIMFIQVCIVPIPAYVVLVGAVNTSLLTTTFLRFGMIDLWFYLVTITAYIAGCIVAYLIGYKWGKKAVKWVAGSDNEYEKWASLISKKGKWWYAITVILPIFPDDLLCVICGAVKFKFSFFIVANLVCRSIGLFVMIEFLKLVGMMNNGGFQWSVLVWGIALLAEIIAYLILKHRRLNENSNKRDK